MVQRLGARTTRVSTLLPPALGGIVSIRDLGGGSAHGVTNTDTWYAYDRLGSVMLTSDAAGTPAALRWQDAYGNELASELTGSWATPAAGEGYGLTTKWYDGDVEMYYFAHRWMLPAVSIFARRTGVSVMLEHPYSALAGNPIGVVDPSGLSLMWNDPQWWQRRGSGHHVAHVLAGLGFWGASDAAACAMTAGAGARLLNDIHHMVDRDDENQLRHCILSCCLYSVLDPDDAYALLDAHERDGFGDLFDSQRDRWGNAIGEGLAMQGGACGCRWRCLAAWGDGDLDYPEM